MGVFQATGVALAALLLLSGCQEGNRKHNPYDEKQTAPHILGQKPATVSTYAQRILENANRPRGEDAKIRRMELEAQREIERLKAEKELEIARLEAEAEKSKLLTEKELTLKKIQAQLEEIVGDRKLVGWVVALSALFLFLLLWVVVKLFREYHNHRRRLEEERMRHEKEMQEKELQARLAEKMFEALGSGHLDKEQQNRLLESLGHATRQLPHAKE
ncbi:hypothetical protein [Hydrogenimonas sp.]